MPDLLIRIKKKSDGTAALSCTRANGSTTWQRQSGAQARFFPFHDLTHYAVETVLGHRRGFYGLVAEGWDLQDFGAPWPRGPLPKDMDPSEAIVGLFDMERADGASWSPPDFQRSSGGWLLLSEEQLSLIRARRSELFERWQELAPGDTLELPFDLPTADH